jgi:hypothetical protein
MCTTSVVSSHIVFSHSAVSDAEVFNVHVEAGPMRIAFVFDAFR